MTSHSDLATVKAEIDRLTTEFFLAVSFEEGAAPMYENIYELFIESGLLVKNTGSAPEINTVQQFIEPRVVAVRNGELTRFHEIELSETTEIFGNVAHRFNSYAKSGTIKGIPFYCARHGIHAVHQNYRWLEDKRDGLGRRTPRPFHPRAVRTGRHASLSPYRVGLAPAVALRGDGSRPRLCENSIRIMGAKIRPLRSRCIRFFARTEG